MIGRLVQSQRPLRGVPSPFKRARERECPEHLPLFKLAEPNFQLCSFSSKDCHSFITMLRLNMLRASKSLLSFLVVLLAHVATVDRWVH